MNKLCSSYSCRFYLVWELLFSEHDNNFPQFPLMILHEWQFTNAMQNNISVQRMSLCSTVFFCEANWGSNLWPVGFGLNCQESGLACLKHGQHDTVSKLVTAKGENVLPVMWSCCLMSVQVDNELAPHPKRVIWWNLMILRPLHGFKRRAGLDKEAKIYFTVMTKYYCTAWLSHFKGYIRKVSVPHS